MSLAREEPGRLRIRVRNDRHIPTPLFVHYLELGVYRMKPGRRGKPEVLEFDDRPGFAKGAWKTRQTQFNPGASAVLEVTYPAELERQSLCLLVGFGDGTHEQRGGGWSNARTYHFKWTLKELSTLWEPFGGEVKPLLS